MTDDDTSSLQPIRDDTADTAIGFDKTGVGSFNLTRLLGLVRDCDDQPPWRTRASLSAAYVDGKQFTPEQQTAAIAEGLGDIRPTNLIGRVIRSVCGAEAKARTDVKIEADDDETADTCDVLNVKLKEAQRETYADMAVSGAYFGQVGPGVGWVEVARNADPLDYAYRVCEVPRHEIWWDFKDPDLVLRGARWVARMRWQDLDELEAAMPKHRTLLRRIAGGTDGFIFDGVTDEVGMERASAEQAWGDYRRGTEWFDGSRKRVKLYEVWYKTPAMGIVLHLGPTRRVLFDQHNQSHIQAAAGGQVRITRQLTRQVRCALFAGPYRLQDYGTRRRNFPYVPFFAYRDDEDLSPYGLVEGMIGPQNGYNGRRLRIEWLLRARQVYVDSDALDTKANSLAEIARMIQRPNMTVVLNPNRKNVNGFQVLSNLQLQKEQIDVMMDDKQLIQDVPGVYGSQLGQAQSGVTSGIANSLLIEQGAVAMGDLNDNYRHSRRMVYENLMDLLVEDHRTPNLEAKIGRGSARRTVVLNVWDGENNTMVNSVADAVIRVGLAEVPSTAAFRMQQQQQLSSIVQALAQISPQAAGVMAPSFIEQTDLPDRMERADDVRRALGMPTAGDKQAQAEAQEQQAADEQKKRQLADIAMQLEMEGKQAEVEKTRSDTELNKAKVLELGHAMGTSSIASASAAESAQQARLPSPGDADKAIVAQQNQLIEEALSEALAEPA